MDRLFEVEIGNYKRSFKIVDDAHPCLVYGDHYGCLRVDGDVFDGVMTFELEN